MGYGAPAAHPLPGNDSPSPAPARSEVQPPHTGEMQAPSVHPRALPLDSRQQGRLCATSYRGRHRTFLDGHVLGIRGGPSAHSLETTWAWRNTMISTRISCSNWSRSRHITRPTTG